MDGSGGLQESALYGAVKLFLERLGYAVKGEICGCDMVAVRAGEPPFVVVCELKLGFSLELVLQAVDRLAVADEVWVAVPATRSGRDRDRRSWALCRRLGIGLLSVQVAKGAVAVLVEPGPYDPRRNQRRRVRVLTEHRRRVGDPAVGGSTRVPIMTAYRQRALACAALLRDGPKRLAELRTVAEDAAGIMRRNVYGWFAREGRGVYRLSETGREAVTPDP
jgi:hypothetical protein